MQQLFALLLVLEGLSSALRFLTRLSVLSVYPPFTLAFIGARFLVAVQQFAAGWMVFGRRPPGLLFARWVLVQSALLYTVGLGFGFAPTSLFPAHRWWVVGAYWVYALAGLVIFRPTRRL
jgi:hypothetical protein